MKHNTLIWIIIILLLSNTATFVGIFYGKHHGREASPPPPFGLSPMADGHLMHHLKDSLTLSPQQIQKLKGLRSSFKANIKDIETAMHHNRMAMLKIMHRSPIDTIKVQTLAAEHGKLHEKLKLNTAHFFIAMQNELDSVQQEKLFVFFNSMNQRPHKRLYHKHKRGKCPNKQ